MDSLDKQKDVPRAAEHPFIWILNEICLMYFRERNFSAIKNQASYNSIGSPSGSAKKVKCFLVKGSYLIGSTVSP